MRKAVLTVIALLATAGAAEAQKAAVSGIVQQYNDVKGFIIRSAEMVPQEKYSYAPTQGVRSFGALVGHIIDAQAVVCPAIKGQSVQYSTVNEKITSKAELVTKLKASFAACDAVLAGLSDSDLGKSATVFGDATTVSGALTLNTAHDWEHYGNMVTYLRMMGMVPPSSQR